MPPVIGADEEILAVAEGTVLVVDGPAGTVTIDPDAETLARHRGASGVELTRSRALLAGSPRTRMRPPSSTLHRS